MKKSKIVIALLLAAVIVIICANVPTFSWFTRPQTHTGNEFVLGTESNQYNAYNGSGVEIVDTKMSNDDGVTFTESVSNFNGSNLPMYGRNYYCTTIRNTSSTEQNVSLYASTLTSNIVQFALGVNGPTRTYHDYTMLSAGEATKTNGTTMRVYFKRPTDYNEWLSGNYDVKWWDNNNHEGYVHMTDCDSTNHDYYFADIPKTATGMLFKIAGAQDSEKQKFTEDIYFSNTDQSDINSRVYLAYNQYTDYSNVKIGEHQHVDGANIVEYYSTITVTNGSFFDAGIEYPQKIGDVEYYSSDESVFTVDGKGIIRTVGIGEATLYTKVTGPSYGDSMQVGTEVTVAATGNQVYKDVPIVKNIKIPAYNSADTSDNPAHDVKIYWYVVNNTTAGTALSYTIDNIYLGL